MPKLIDLLKSLGTKSKLDLTKPEFVAVLEASKDIEVPQAFADQVETSLMTTEAAMSNSAVRARIKAEVLNGEDAYLNGIITDLDLDDEVKTGITSEKDTAAKIRKTIVSLNEAKKKAKKAGDTGTEQALKDQVTELNKQLKTIKEAHTSEINKINSDRDNDFIKYEMMDELGAKSYVFPDGTPSKLKKKYALIAVEEKLAQKGLKVIKTESGVKLVKLDGTDAYDDKNNLLALPSFMDGALADAQLLKNSDPNQKGNNGNNNSQFNAGGQGQQPVNTEFLNQNREYINALVTT